MKRGCFKFFIGTLCVISVSLAGLYIIARLAGPEESIDSLLKKLPEPELAALQAVCAEEGIDPKQLRPLGIANDSLLRDDRNARSIVIRDGHVRVLCLRNLKTNELHDVSSLTELEVLWLEHGKLTTWPELASLTKLTDLQLNGQPLDSPGSNYLPVSLKRLGLAGTKVTSIEWLKELPLDEMNLAYTPITSLPADIPAKGSWVLNLDDTVITRPPGYHTQLPAGTNASGPTLPGGKIEGMAGHKTVDVHVTGTELKGRTTLTLPTNTTLYHTSGPVEVTGSVASGTVRVWLQEPEGLFDGPWFKAGKVVGFGMARANGFVATEITVGGNAKARGSLIVQGAAPRFAFVIQLEPVGNAPVTGIDLLIRTAP